MNRLDKIPLEDRKWQENGLYYELWYDALEDLIMVDVTTKDGEWYDGYVYDND